MSIRDIRKNKHISARKVYTKLNIDKSTFKNMEECKSSMKVEWLPILASMYGITKEELLEEYEFSEEYLNINTTKDDTNKILTRQEHDTTVETLLTKIDTSGTITVKDKDSKEELDKTNIIKTGDTVEIALEEKTEIYTISVLGDINGDGKIDNGDVALLYNNLKGKKTFEKYQTFAGDIINDSSIKINDVARLYRFFKKRVDTLEVEK